MKDQNSTNSIGSQSDSSYKMDSSNENIDHAILQEAGDTMEISAEWSVTTSAFNSSDTTSSNTNININTLKECCADSINNSNGKNDFMVVESTSKKINPDESKNLTMCKTTAFQKKHKSSFSNVSHMFENILDDDSQMEESIYLNHFQKRKRLLPPSDEDFVDINKSVNSERDSINLSMKSSKTKFKHPSNFSFINGSTNNIDESKTEVLPHKFTRRTVDLVNSAFDNVINDSSMTSSIESNNKNATLNELSESNLNRNSLCDTEEIPSLNHTYDIPVNSTQVGLLSQSIKMYSELSNIEQPINETYRLENNLKSNNVSLESSNTKKTLSDTYTIENNLNDTSARLKSSNKTISTLTDMSNIYNQSKSSIRKPNFIRKLQLDDGSQEYNITIGGDNSTVNDEINQEENNKSKRFKLDNIHHDANSIIFDDIITSCQRNETSTTDTISKTLNDPVDISTNNDLLNISHGCSLKENLEVSVKKSTTQQSNMHQNKFVENDKNISNPHLLKSNKSNSFSQRSSKFNFSKQFGRLSVSYHEKNCHDLSVPQNTTFMLSQSPGPHFAGKKSLNAHSEVFNDLIDNSANSDITLNMSKAVKFKNHKNVFEGDSIMFENVIINSQESNSTFSQNKTLSRSVIFDQSKIQANDEISLYANANDLSFEEKSSENSNNSFRNHESSEISNLEGSKTFKDELKNESIISVRSSNQKNNSLTSNTINKSAVPTVADESYQLYARENVSNHSSRTSKTVAYSNNGSIDNNDIDNSDFFVSSESSIDSDKTSNDTSMLEIDPNNGAISASFSKESNNSFVSDKPAGSNITVEPSEINKSSIDKSSRLSSMSVKKNKSLSNETVLENESLISKNNVNNMSTRSSRSSKSVAYSNNELNDSKFSTSSESSIDSEKTSNDKSVLEIDTNNSTTSSNSSKLSNNSFTNDRSTGSSIIDEFSTINKSSSSKVTRLSSVSVKKNKSLSNESIIDNKSLISKNTVINMSTRSSRRSKSVAYSNNELNDSKFSTSSESSIDSEKTSNDKSVLEIDTNSGTIFSNLSKQSNNLFTNDRSTGSSIIDELSKINKSSSSKVTQLSSMSVKKNDSLSNEIIFENESSISKNNVNNVSTRSSRRSKSVAYSKNESTANDEIYDSGSVLWTTLSVSSIDSENTSLNVLTPKDCINSVDEISTHLAEQKNDSVVNNPSVISSIIDELPENKSSSSKLTRLSSISVKNSKSPSNKTVVDNESVVSDNNVSKVSTRSSKNIAQSNIDDVDNVNDDSQLWTTISGCSMDSRKTSNSISTPGDLNDIDTISTRVSKQKNCSVANDVSAVSNIIHVLPENNKSSSSTSTKTSSVSKKKNKSLSNKTVLDNESVTSDNNISKVSTRSSKNITQSNIDDVDNVNDDSQLWSTVSGCSTDSRKISNSILTPGDLNDIDTISTRVSKQKNTSVANDVSAVSNIIDVLPEINKSSSFKSTNLSFESKKKKKSSSNKKVLDNESVTSDNNVSKVSTRSSKNITHSNIDDVDNVNDDSQLWTTVSGLSTDSRKTSDYILTSEDLNNVSTTSTNMSKQKNNKSSSSKLTKSFSVSVNNNKSSSSITVLDSESVTSDNNVSKVSTRSSKNIIHSNIDGVGNVNDDSQLWTTVSGLSTDSRKTSDNILTSEDLNNVSTTSTNMSKQKNNKSSSSKLTKSFSVSVNNNESSSNITVLDSESVASDNNVSKVSTRSSENISRSNIENIDNENDDSIFWATVSWTSTDSRKASNSLLKPEDLNNIGITSTNLLKQTNSSLENNQSAVPSITDNNKSSSTRVTRSSSKYIKNNKSLVSRNNQKNTSTRSSRTSKSVAHSNYENVDETGNSMDWTSISDDNSLSKLPSQNEFNTPTNNKIVIQERIINTIGLMSANKQKSTHPGVFELEKNVNGPLTRSFAQSPNHSPSILTRVLVANNTFESESSITDNISIDQLQIENKVKEKFKSLYNKESWITKRLYNFLISKLQLKYGIYSVKYAEKFVKYLASVLKQVHRDKVNFQLYTDMLKYHMARYGIIEDTSDYLRFLTNYIPRPYYDRLIPGWNLEASDVKFDPHKYFIPIMEDEEFLSNVLENLNTA